MTAYDNPLIVQSDRTVLLEVAAPRAREARAALARFAELEKSPEHAHTYRISALSLWNAASAGSPPTTWRPPSTASRSTRRRRRWWSTSARR